MSQSRTISFVALLTYFKVFPPSKWDPVIHRTTEEAGYNIWNLYASAIRISSFLFLPNQIPDNLVNSTNYNDSKTQRKIWKQIWINMTGWNKSDSRPFRIFKGVTLFSIYSIGSIIGTTWNIVRSITEMAPSLIANIFKHYANNADETLRDLADKRQSLEKDKNNYENEYNLEKELSLISQDNKTGKAEKLLRQLRRTDKKLLRNAKVQSFVSNIRLLLKACYYFVESFHFAGKAITAPRKGGRSAWRSAHKQEHTGNNKRAGDLLGGVLVTLNFCITFGFYAAFLFPAISGLLAGTAVGASIGSVAGWLEPLSSIIKNFLLTPLFEGLGITLTSSAVGGFFLGGGVLTVAAPAALANELVHDITLVDIFNFLQRKWNNFWDPPKPYNEEIEFKPNPRLSTTIIKSVMPETPTETVAQTNTSEDEKHDSYQLHQQSVEDSVRSCFDAERVIQQEVRQPGLGRL